MGTPLAAESDAPPPAEKEPLNVPEPPPAQGTPAQGTPAQGTPAQGAEKGKPQALPPVESGRGRGRGREPVFSEFDAVLMRKAFRARATPPPGKLRGLAPDGSVPGSP